MSGDTFPVGLMFSSPEQLLSDKGRKLLKNRKLNTTLAAIVIDESHCIEKWYVISVSPYIIFILFQEYKGHGYLRV